MLFFLNMFYNESLYYLLCLCTNPIFGNKLYRGENALGQQDCRILKSTIVLEKND